MSVNESKKHDPKFWRLWYESGAVKQSILSDDDLIIMGIGTNFVGPGKGFSVLSLGDRIINSGPDWSVSTPAFYARVSINNNYKPGMKLERLPGNAVPSEIAVPRGKGVIH